MPSIDERVVAMAFENATFEARLAQTMRSLSKLDTALQQIGSKNSLQDIEKSANKVTLEQPMSALDKLKARFGNAGQGATEGFNEIERAGNKVQLEEPIRALNKVQSETANVGRSASEGFNEIEKASNRVNLQGVTHAIESVQAKFSVLQGAASVALGNIATNAFRKGGQFAKAFSFGPIQQGFEEYQTNLSSIQTIMANTEGQRISGLRNTNKYLNELNRYSDKTIYNFSQMARNIGTFTAAGVDLKTATASIKGIANLAALSGSNAQQASTAMYQLSQAIAAGKVGLQDWNSVVNAGMGGRKFQNSLIQTGVALGTIEKGAVKVDKATGKATINGQSFRESIMAAPGKESWLTSDVLTGSLEQFTGDMTDAELRAKGFSEAQIKSIQATAKTAQEAATQVKTLPQVFDVAKEAIGSGWAQTFSAIFGNFNQAKKTFTELSNTINGIIGQNAKARNTVLKEWNKAGGRLILIEGIKNAFKALAAFLKPIGEAFRDIFPRKTSEDLLTMTKHFRDFTKELKPSAETIDGIRRTFRGLFAALSIGWYIVKKVIGVITDLLGIAGDGSGGFLKFTGGIGDFVTAMQKAIVKGDALGGFFKGITNILRVPLDIVKALASALFGLFDGFDGDKAKEAGKTVEGVGDKAKSLEDIIQGLKKTVTKAINFFNKLFEPFANFVSGIGHMFANIGTTIADALKGADSGKILEVFQTVFLGGIFVYIKKAISGGDFIVNPLKQLSGVLTGLTNNLKAMQQALKAGTLLAIAASIVALAVGVKLLSTIEPDKLKTAMAGVAVGLGELVAALSFLEGATTLRASASLPLIAASLVGMAIAVTILAGAVKLFSMMSWEDLVKGLAGVTGAMVALSVGLKGMGGVQLTVMAPGLIAVAVAMNILGVAMKIFSGLSWEEIAKGIIGINGALVSMNLGLKGMGPTLLLVGPGLIAASLGLTLLAGAVSAFGAMDVPTLIKGILGLGGALVVLGATLQAMPPGPMLILQAAGLVILALALTGIAGAIGIMGKMSLGTIVKGLVTLGAALAELAIGLNLMSSTLPGAVALLAAAGALAILAPALAFLGTLKWGTIFKGLVAIAGVLLTLGLVGGIAAAPLIALGAALTVLGIATLTVGAGIYLIAKALVMLGDASVKSVGILIAAITAFVAAIPKMIIEFIKGLVEILASLGTIAPKVVDSLSKILHSLIQVVINETPQLAKAIGVLVQQLLIVVVRDSPKLIRAGMTLILNLLKGIDQNIGKVVNRVASIIIKFLNAMANKAPALTKAGARALVAFLKGIGDHITEVTKMGTRILVKFVAEIAKLPAKLAGVAADGIIAFLDKISKKLPKIVTAALHLARVFVHQVARGLLGLIDIVGTTMIKFAHKLATWIRTNSQKFWDAGWDIASALIDGLLEGFRQLWDKVEDKLNWLADHIPGPIKKALEILSPSRVMMRLGKMIVLGLAVGIGDHTPKVMQAMQKVAGVTKSGFALGLSDMGAVMVAALSNPLRAMLRKNHDMREMGQFLGNEFKAGLTGGIWDKNSGKSQAVVQIEDTFKSLREKLGEEQQKLRDKVKEDRKKLNDLMGEEHPNLRKIQKAYQALTLDTILLARATAGSSNLMKNLQGSKDRLRELADKYDLVTKRLEKAQEVFAQFDTLPDVSGLVDDAVQQAALSGSEQWEAIRKEEADKEAKHRIDQVQLYKDSLRKQIAATTQYMQTLKKLRAAGLDDQTFQSLLEMGTAGQEFASQLLSSGKGGIEQINKLDSQLAKASSKLATNAAKALVHAGDQAAQGLITGLQTRQAEIRKTMEQIASSMIKAIKHQLGIRSPSQIFAEIGTFSVRGLADGLSSSSHLVRDAAADIGDDAADALTKSLARISEHVQNGIDTDVTITPVLDLSQVQKDASKIQDLADVIPITAAASFGQASAISQATQETAAAQAEAAQTNVEFKFEQNNTSPKALDDVEIYRQTRNGLSQVKSALGLVTAVNP